MTPLLMSCVGCAGYCSLADDGALGRRKVFSRRHVLVELAPPVFGWQPRLVNAVGSTICTVTWSA